MASIHRVDMSETPRTGTHVQEWADLVGDEVPERARRERTLEGSRRPDPDPDDDWGSAS
jgi:hypothetical protein